MSVAMAVLQGKAFSLANEADTELLADYQLSDDDDDDSRPAGHSVFATASPVAGDSDVDDDIMGGDFESDPEVRTCMLSYALQLDTC